MTQFPKSTLILGGASSGKSAFAETLIKTTNRPLIYLASATAHDNEMDAKIQRHRQQRGQGWHTIEEPLDAAGVLARRKPGEALLFDCATLWLSNHMGAGHDIDAAQSTLIQALDTCPASVVTVSNEVGHGIVPEHALSRQFRDAQGRLNVALAAQADLVVMVVAGLAQVLKGTLPQ